MDTLTLPGEGGAYQKSIIIFLIQLMKYLVRSRPPAVTWLWLTGISCLMRRTEIVLEAMVYSPFNHLMNLLTLGFSFSLVAMKTLDNMFIHHVQRSTHKTSERTGISIAIKKSLNKLLKRKPQNTYCEPVHRRHLPSKNWMPTKLVENIH